MTRRDPGRRQEWLTVALAALAHAALFALAQEPITLWPAAFVSVAPLVWIALWAVKPGRAFAVVWAVAFVMWLWLERWLIGVTAFGWPMLAAYLALYPAAFVWIGGRIARRAPGSRWGIAVALALVWTGLEMLRGEVVLTGYSWFLLAHPLIDTPIAQLAEWGGVYGVTFVVALAQAIAVVALTRRCVPIAIVVRLFAAAAIVAAGSSLGVALLARERGRASASVGEISVAVVQTNVPQSNKTGWTVADRVRDFARMQELTVEAGDWATDRAGDGPARGNTGETPVPLGMRNTGETPVPPDLVSPVLDLIVWPETMFPGETLSPEAVAEFRRAGLVYEDGTPTWAFNEAIGELQRAVGVPMLVGAIGYDGLRIGSDERGITIEHNGKYNSAFLIERGSVRAERYDKLHLTPFGEVMPGISWSDRLERMLLSIGAPGMAFDLDSGSGRTVFGIEHAPEAGGDGEESDAPGAVGDERAAQSAVPPDSRTGETPVPPDLVPLGENTGETPVPPDSNAERTARRAVPPRGGVRIVTPICFEAATARVCRRLVFERGVRRADVMVNLTNDGWFGDTPGKREQHLLVARWRAIELRTPMVRAANTGVSVAFDTTGRIQAIGPENRSERVNTDGVMRALVAMPVSGATLYARFGDAAGWATLAMTVLLTGWTFTPGRTPGRSKSKGSGS